MQSTATSASAIQLSWSASTDSGGSVFLTGSVEGTIDFGGNGPLAYPAGADTLQKLEALDKITSLQETGKAQEALATVGQYFGTDAGANMQAFNKVVHPRICQIAALESLDKILSKGGIETGSPLEEFLWALLQGKPW